MNEAKLMPTKGQQFFGRRPSFTFDFFLFCFLFAIRNPFSLEIDRGDRKWPGNDVLVNHLSEYIIVEGYLSV